jgi:hypothetical protein
MNEIAPTVTPATIKPMPLANPGVTRREEVFNDVIAGLGFLMTMASNTHDSETVVGIEMALEYVKAMQKAETQ